MFLSKKRADSPNGEGDDDDHVDDEHQDDEVVEYSSEEEKKHAKKASAGVRLPNGAFLKHAPYDSDSENEVEEDEEIDSDYASADEDYKSLKKMQLYDGELINNPLFEDGDDDDDDDDLDEQIQDEESDGLSNTLNAPIQPSNILTQPIQEVEPTIPDDDYTKPFYTLPPADFLQNSDVVIMKTVTNLMASVFHRELRKSNPIQITHIKPDEQPITPHDPNNRSLNAAIINQSYFKLNNNVVELDESYKTTSTVMRDTDQFIQKESELTNIEKRILAPRFKVTSRDELKKMSKKERFKDDKHEQELSTLDHELYKDYKNKQNKSKPLEKWNNMQAPQLTPELQMEVQAMALKHAAEGRGKNKKAVADLDNLPKYFQVGTVVEGKHEFYSSRVVRRKRHQSILDELVAQNEETGYVSQRYKEIQDNLSNVQVRKKRRISKKIKK
ncbi:rRNA-processing protein fcf2 [Acrasis kona]|uniref:rRNA-processing protein fcf2 n=1 Tax=Acrasis kona TaxID=1008807 RepID=A0AAW2ZNX1_9EUKA